MHGENSKIKPVNFLITFINQNFWGVIQNIFNIIEAIGYSKIREMI